jgi:hypothetical protein
MPTDLRAAVAAMKTPAFCREIAKSKLAEALAGRMENG